MIYQNTDTTSWKIKLDFLTDKIVNREDGPGWDCAGSAEFCNYIGDVEGEELTRELKKQDR